MTVSSLAKNMKMTAKQKEILLNNVKTTVYRISFSNFVRITIQRELFIRNRTHMYTLRLLIIIFLMTASNLYAQQREDDKANSVIMSSQANRLIERGEYEEALKLLQKAEKTYAANNDTLTSSFIVVFLAPQFECYRMMKRYEEATYISYRIMMINRKKATRSEIQPNNRETRQRKTEAVTKAPVKAAEDEGDDYDIDYVLAVACALALIYAVMATGFLSYYIHRARRKDKAQMQILGRLQRYKRLLYGYERGELVEAPRDQSAVQLWLMRPGSTEEDHLFAQIMKAIVEKKMYLNPNLSREDVIKEVYVPKNKFANLFKTYVRTNFKNYINSLRIDAAIELMQLHPDYTIEAISQECGMASVQTFYRVFGEQTGMSPSEYRINLQSEADGGGKNHP